MCFNVPLCRTLQLVSWYFEPSQPQRVTLWLKTMFNLAPIYHACKSSNHKLSKNHKISPDTNLHENHKQTQNFLRISLFGITPVKKAHKARTHWYHGLFHRFIDTRFLKSIKKKWTEAMKNSNTLYKCIAANTSVIWQHVAHTTNRLLLTAKQEPYKKAYLLTKNIEEFSGKSLKERASRQKTIRQKG